jgi:hypothetical protein
VDFTRFNRRPIKSKSKRCEIYMRVNKFIDLKNLVFSSVGSWGKF